MPNQPHNSESDKGFAPLTSEEESEARALIDAALNGLITPEQHRRLEQLVIENRSVARLYLEVVHLWYSIPLHVSREALDLNAAQNRPGAPLDNPMSETMILPALRESEPSDEEIERFLPAASTSSIAPPRRSNRKWWLGGSAAAAVLIFGISIIWALHGQKSKPAAVLNPAPAVAAAKAPATITATAAVASGQPRSAIPGTELAADQTFQLTDGAAEITFASGAVAVVRGPAQIRIVDQNTVTLESGSIAVHVPAEAVGFHVISPGLSVVDLGTNFGVRALPDGSASEVHVFGGKVDAGGTDATGRPTTPVVHMSTGEAVRHEVASVSPPVPIAFSPAAFTRDITEIKVPVPMHDTGDEGSPGGADPHWQLVSFPNNPNWQARPAMILTEPTELYTKSIGSRKWIAVNPAIDDQPTGTFSFRTMVDLSGLDPASATISANVAADDYVADIRVNGMSTSLTTETKVNHNGYEKTELAIPAKFWHPGVNQIDVLVMNRPQNFTPNCVALHVDWTASGHAAVHR